jgi:hypothetical protein
MRHCLPHSPKSNFALHRIAARVRFLLNLKGHGWAARGERWALDDKGARRPCFGILLWRA